MRPALLIVTIPVLTERAVDTLASITPVERLTSVIRLLPSAPAPEMVFPLVRVSLEAAP